jgi:hypothetical protein
MWSSSMPKHTLKVGPLQGGTIKHARLNAVGSGEAGVGDDIWLNKRLTPETITFTEQEPSFRG